MQNDLYEYTRAIRFNLVGEDAEEMMPSFSDDDSANLISRFYENYQLVIVNFLNAFFTSKQDGSIDSKAKVEIKKDFLRQYLRESFYKKPESERYQSKKNRETGEVEKTAIPRFAAADFGEDLYAWYARNNDLKIKITALASRPLETQARKADLGLLVREVMKKENYGFIEYLSRDGMVVDKITDEHLAALRNSVEPLKSLLDKVLLLISPNLKNGYELARASFNYHAVNKQEKNWKDLEQEIDAKFASAYSLDEHQKRLFRQIGFDPANLTLLNLYNEMKAWKAEQKKQFNLAVQAGETVEQLQRKFPLFDSLFALKHYVSLSRGNPLRADQKRERGKLLMTRRDGFDRWVDFTQIFKDVAMKVGKIKAEKRAFIQEKIDLELLRYWVVFYETGGKKKILLVDKNKREEVLGELKQLEKGEDGDTIKIIHSITMKSIDKLIRRNLPEQIPVLSGNDNPGLIALYKDILSGRKIHIQPEFIAQNNPGIKRVVETDFAIASREDFRAELEKVSYFIESRKITPEQVQELKTKYGVYELEISSYDMERANITGSVKAPTALWNDFWTNPATKIRFNPEVRIFCRPKQDNLPLEKQKNRNSKNHLGITFTITENAGARDNNNAFTQELEQANQIKRFNEDIIDEIFVKKHEAENDLWYYGIDRGAAELATLCVVRFSKEEYEATKADNRKVSFHKPEPANFSVYRIKNDKLTASKKIKLTKTGEEKEIFVYKNPSYFLNEDEEPDSEIFEKQEQSSLDLTCAKLIKGKIIVNGDILTQLNFKKISSRRRLFDNRQSIGKNRLYIDEESGIVKVDAMDGAKIGPFDQLHIYYGDDLNAVCPIGTFVAELNDYLDSLRGSANFTEDDISIDKANNYKDALTANMVGIIAHLFEQYPGIINLENMHSRKHIDSHNRRYGGEIVHRHLEWALYAKFQKLGLVPPRLKNTILLREGEDAVKRLGIIHFIPIEDTSQNCPFCGEANREKNHNARGHEYRCHNPNCEFNTNTNRKDPLGFIDNSDTSAAYNIAKSDTEPLPRDMRRL
jgi:hypothetical protein